jgi:hypothetical protein
VKWKGLEVRIANNIKGRFRIANFCNQSKSLIIS